MSAKAPKYAQNGNHACVHLNGQRISLGRWNSDESKKKYKRILAEYYADDGLPVGDDPLVMELVCRFMDHAECYYRRPDGSATSEVLNFQRALQPCLDLYGDVEVSGFGPRQLEAVRAVMVKKGWVRNQINIACRRIVACFAWGVAKELVRPDQIIALKCLQPLKKGRCQAAEGEAVTSVPQDHIDAVLAVVPRVVADMIQIQLLTGCRPGEVVQLTPAMIHRDGDTWSAELTGRDKMAYKGKPRIIYFGPKAQAILAPYLLRADDAALFSPREAIAQRAAACGSHRRPDQKANQRASSRRVGCQYDVAAYRRAIRYGCQKANVQAFGPHRLRHNAATEIRRQFGLEAAQVILGHATADVTQIYAERDQARAAEIAAKWG